MGPSMQSVNWARYTRRVATSNNRILEADEKTVSFKGKDYRDNRRKFMELDFLEFIRRFMCHTLPTGYIQSGTRDIFISKQSDKDAGSKNKNRSQFTRGWRHMRYCFLHWEITGSFVPAAEKEGWNTDPGYNVS